MTMAKLHSGFRYWCCKCDREINWFDGKMCRVCDPVERINTLAEKVAQYPKSFYDYYRGHKLAYIEACDIILEADND